MALNPNVTYYRIVHDGQPGFMRKIWVMELFNEAKRTVGYLALKKNQYPIEPIFMNRARHFRFKNSVVREAEKLGLTPLPSNLVQE